LRLDRKLSFTQVAAAIGVSESQYIKMERGQRPSDVEKLMKLAAFFRVPIPELLTPTEGIPVVGTLRNNGIIEFAPDATFYRLSDFPPTYTLNTRALKIEGNAMPLDVAGWLIMYEDIREPVDGVHVGQWAIIWAPGEPRVRKIERGSQPGRYDLICGDREFDVAVEEISLVTAFIPDP
jgi:transcriptional regulator with XRE-family HTH domain